MPNHEVGRATYEAYSEAARLIPHAWDTLPESGKAIWRTAEIAGLKASAEALNNCSKEHEIKETGAAGGAGKPERLSSLREMVADKIAAVRAEASPHPGAAPAGVDLDGLAELSAPTLSKIKSVAQHGSACASFDSAECGAILRAMSVPLPPLGDGRSARLVPSAPRAAGGDREGLTDTVARAIESHVLFTPTHGSFTKAAREIAEDIVDALSARPTGSGGRGRDDGWSYDMAAAPRDGSKVDLMYPYPRARTINCLWRQDAIMPDGGWIWRSPRWATDEVPFRLLPENEWDIGCYPGMQPYAWRRADDAAPLTPSEGKTQTPSPDRVEAGGGGQ